MSKTVEALRILGVMVVGVTTLLLINWKLTVLITVTLSVVLILDDLRKKPRHGRNYSAWRRSWPTAVAAVLICLASIVKGVVFSPSVVNSGVEIACRDLTATIQARTDWESIRLKSGEPTLAPTEREQYLAEVKRFLTSALAANDYELATAAAQVKTGLTLMPGTASSRTTEGLLARESMDKGIRAGVVACRRKAPDIHLRLTGLGVMIGDTPDQNACARLLRFMDIATALAPKIMLKTGTVEGSLYDLYSGAAENVMDAALVLGNAELGGKIVILVQLTDSYMEGNREVQPVLERKSKEVVTNCDHMIKVRPTAVN